MAGLFLFAAAPAAEAETVTLVAHLLGSSALPKTDSDAFAEAQFTYDTENRELQYYVNYDGVTPAKADIHAVSASAKGPSLLSLPVSEFPISGAIKLNQDLASDLLAGKLYLDIHTAARPDGDIGGAILRH